MQFISAKKSESRIKYQEYFLLQTLGIQESFTPKKYNHEVLPMSSIPLN